MNPNTKLLRITRARGLILLWICRCRSSRPRVSSARAASASASVSFSARLVCYHLFRWILFLAKTIDRVPLFLDTLCQAFWCLGLCLLQVIGRVAVELCIQQMIHPLLFCLFGCCFLIQYHSFRPTLKTERAPPMPFFGIPATQCPAWWKLSQIVIFFCH